jgi:hypothetical protein
MFSITPESASVSTKSGITENNKQLGEVIEIHWPMDVPKYASFAVYSSQPLAISAPRSMEIQACTPMHIRCDIKLTISPAGPATPGFARGWLKLPTELKLQILRHNLLLPSPLWPSNINTVTRRELLPYLRMTPDIAEIAKSVFYQENRFIMQFSSSTPNSWSTLARPPMSIRPQLRRITFLTRLTTLDWQILRSISRQDCAGFTSLFHLTIRCLSCETAASIMLSEHQGEAHKISRFEAEYRARRGEPVHFPFDGVVMYDRSGFVTTGIQDGDDARWAWVRRIEEYVSRDITFTK